MIVEVPFTYLAHGTTSRSRTSRLALVHDRFPVEIRELSSSRSSGRIRFEQRPLSMVQAIDGALLVPLRSDGIPAYEGDSLLDLPYPARDRLVPLAHPAYRRQLTTLEMRPSADMRNVSWTDRDERLSQARSIVRDIALVDGVLHVAAIPLVSFAMRAEQGFWSDVSFVHPAFDVAPRSIQGFHPSTIERAIADGALPGMRAPFAIEGDVPDRSDAWPDVERYCVAVARSLIDQVDMASYPRSGFPGRSFVPGLESVLAETIALDRVPDLAAALDLLTRVAAVATSPVARQYHGRSESDLARIAESLEIARRMAAGRRHVPDRDAVALAF